MSGFEKTAAEVLAGVPDTVTFAPSRMSNTATRLRALERFVIEIAVEQGLARQAAAFGTLGRDRDEVCAEIKHRAERRLSQLQDEEAIPWPPPNAPGG